MGVAGRAQEGGDIGIVMTELSCCVAETNTTCKAIILQLKNKVKKKKEKKIAVGCTSGLGCPSFITKQKGSLELWRGGIEEII